MTEVSVDLFCEDSGHEIFTRALLTRIAADLGIPLRITPRSARGGHCRAITELKGWF